MKFNELNVSNDILRAMDTMGFETMTEVQQKAIPLMLQGLDVIAQAPTGTGKTAAFGIPLVEGIDPEDGSVQALILCPTRELALQITDVLTAIARYTRGVRVVTIYGGQAIQTQMNALKQKPQIVVATPGRLMDHMRRKSIHLDQLKYLILDEADEMLNMGFRSDIDTILLSAPSKRQTALFSATLSKEIRDIASTYQKEAVTVRVTPQQVSAPGIAQYYIEVRSKSKAEVLMRMLDANDYKLVLIFTNTKRMTDKLTKYLKQAGYPAEALHGDMTQSQRDRVMHGFRDGTVSILVATDVAARGIDVDDIDAVFNFDVPQDQEYYVHRIGRTGRANRAGVAYTLVNQSDLFELDEIIRYTKQTILPYAAPSYDEAERKRANIQLQAAVDLMDTADLTHSKRFIQDMIDKVGDIDSMDIAAALLQLNTKPRVQLEPFDMGRSSRQQKGGQRRSKPAVSARSANAQRMFINIGSLDRIRDRHIVELATQHAGLAVSDISNIRIFDKFSFFEVPKQSADAVIKKLKGMPYKGRTLGVERANAKKR
ncbi:DEAD/DEAH box helicase [Eubacteriales bacterium OttesenSCG-928-N14]|nr:DEAD/DEAH box helicase [Eubacteriales bacterium OttesenSCG-928-N14]